MIRGAMLAPVALALLARAPSAAAAPDPAVTNSVTISAVGDIMAHRIQITSAFSAACKCYDFKPVFAEVKELLTRADLTVGNLETTFPGDSTKLTQPGRLVFGTPDSLADALVDAGFDVLADANNHAVDTGPTGIRHTLDVLDKHGLAHLGTYASDADFLKRRVLLVEKNGLKLGFLNYTFSTNGEKVSDGVRVNMIDRAQIAEDMALAHKAADAVIVIYHFGDQYEREPDRGQRDVVAFTFEQGADVVLGSHPHVLQPFEVVRATDRYGVTKDRLVIYSLGNFIANYRMRYTDGGVIFNFRLHKGAAGVEVSDVGYQPVWVYPTVGDDGNVGFHILPVERYLANDQPLKLNAGAMKKMMLFYEDTQKHYAASVESTKRLKLAEAP